jgi:hypothetical protein
MSSAGFSEERTERGTERSEEKKSCRYSVISGRGGTHRTLVQAQNISLLPQVSGSGMVYQLSETKPVSPMVDDS